MSGHVGELCVDDVKASMKILLKIYYTVIYTERKTLISSLVSEVYILYWLTLDLGTRQNVNDYPKLLTSYLLFC